MNLILTQISANDALIIVLFLIAGYLMGSIPHGLIIGKLFKNIDIREYGSKNIGATNSIRILGKKLGYTVFFLDMLKGIWVMAIVRILGHFGIWSSPVNVIAYGSAAVIGHSFSIFLGFKGGKSVAVSLGVVLFLSPIPGIACLIVFAILVFTTGYVSLGSTFAALTVTTVGWIQYFFGIQYTDNNVFTYFISTLNIWIPIMYTIFTGMIIIRHRKNYIRLAQGTENSFKKKKKSA